MACNRGKKMIYLTPEEMPAADESTVFVVFMLKMIREGNARTEMKVYHMSDTLCLGAELSLNYKKNWELTEPVFVYLDFLCLEAMVSQLPDYIIPRKGETIYDQIIRRRILSVKRDGADPGQCGERQGSSGQDGTGRDEGRSGEGNHCLPDPGSP